MTAPTTSPDTIDATPCERDGCNEPARRCGCEASHCDEHPHADVAIQAEGYEITITRSAGPDGAVVIFIDGPDEDHRDRDGREDGSPGCRVRLNDDPIYVGTAYQPREE